MRFYKFYKSLCFPAFFLALTIQLQNKAIGQVQANYSSTKFKNWIAFRGQDGEFVRFPNSSFWKPEPDLTMEFWIRLNQPVPTVFQHIFGNCWNNPSHTLENNWGFGFALVNNRLGFHVIIKANPTNQFETSNASDTLSGCTWYHVAGVKQGQQTSIYINGVLAAQRTVPVGLIRTFDGPAQLGTNYESGSNNWFNGNIDEFRLWNFARNQTQIQSTMNDTLLGTEAGLRAYYKFNESGQGSGIVVKNSAQISGNQIDGTIESPNSNFPKLTNTETLNFPPPPLVPTQPVLCNPGGQFNMSVNSPTGQNITRFYWYSSDHPDTSRIPNTIRKNYKTPNLTQTDTFFVSAVNSQFCESKKVGVVAKVLPQLVSISLSASKTTFCNSATIQFTATNLPTVKYAWWRGFNGNIPVFNPDSSSSITIPDLDHSDTIWVQYSTFEGNCLSNKAFFIVTKAPKSPAPVLSNSNIRVCKGSKATFSVAGTGTRMVKLFSDSALTQFITQAAFNQPIQTPSVLSDQVFWVALSADTNGCESFGSKLFIGVNPLPDVDAGSSATVCSGKAFQLGQAGNSQYHYQWISSGQLPSPTLPVSFSSDTISNPLIIFQTSFFQVTPQYLVLTVTDRVTGCRNSDSAMVMVGPTPPDLGRVDTTVCGNGQIKMNRFLAPNIAQAYDNVFQYQWNTSMGNFQNPTIRTTILNFINPGQTQVVSQSILHTTDSRTGCSSRDTVLIKSDPLPLAEAGIADTICPGATIQLGAPGNNAYHYQWTPPPVNNPPLIYYSYSSDTISNPILTYWYSASFSIDPKKFLIAATDRITGCKSVDSVEITAGLTLPILGRSDTTVCGSQLIQMSRKLETGQDITFDLPIFEYQWSVDQGGTFQNPNTRKAILSNQNLGQSNIESTAILKTTDTRTGCVTRDTVVIRSNPLPVVEAGANDTICTGELKQLGSAGNPGYHYLWTPGPISNVGLNISYSSDTIADPVLNYSFFNANPQPQKFKISASDRLTGCRNADSVLITAGFTFSGLGISDTVLCGSQPIQMAKNLSIGNTFFFDTSPFILHQWSVDQGGIFQNPNIRNGVLQLTNASQNQFVSTSILATTDLRTNCITRDTVTIISNPLPLVEAGNDTTLCSGFSIQVGLAGNLQTTHYQWVNSTGISNDTIPNAVYQIINTAGTITDQKILTATFRNTGCKRSDTISITVHALPKPNAGQNLSFCFDGSASLGTNQSTGYQYMWSPTDSLSSPTNGQTQIHYFNSDTLSKNLEYVLEMKNDTTGCKATDSVLVRVKGFVRADAGGDKAFCSGVSINMGTTGFQGHIYFWSPTNGLVNPNNDTTSISLTNLVSTNHIDTTIYKRTVTFDGCENEDSIQVRVFPRPKNLEITGSKNVCPGTLATEYQVVSNPLNHFLFWFQSGGAFAGWNAGDSVQVNWGNTNPNAWVRFVPTNMYGCSGDSVFYAVKVNKLLFPEIDIVSDRSLIHNDSVCLNQANPVRYKTRFTTPSSSYQWNIVPPSAGEIVSNPKEREISIRWNALGTYQIFVSQFDTTNIDTCFGTSEYYTVHILPSPDTTLELVGDTIVCAFTTNKLYTLSGSSNSKYDWLITRSGQNQTSPQSPGILSVNFGDVGLDTLRVLETNDIGCPSKLKTKTISVKPLPNTSLSVGNDYNICPNSLLVRGYKVIGLTGSGFEWTTGNNGTITNGAGSDSVTINWNTAGPILKVLETSAFGCRKDTLKFSFNYDASQPVIHSVSTQEADDSKIEIRFELQKPENHPTKTFELWKNGNLLSTFNSTQNILIDSDVLTHSEVYQYQVKSLNGCKTVMETPVLNNILLKVLPGLEEESSLLKWNRYNTASSPGRCDYDILRETDGNQLSGSFGNLSYVNTQQPENLEFTSSGTDNGFKQCYRIFYFEGDASVRRSYSNWACLDFENLLSFPNLITPNGDGKNDAFEVRNLELYPPAEIQIFDRWGKEVFSSKHYLNDWADKDGMYFYTFKSEVASKTGWITVIR